MGVYRKISILLVGLAILCNGDISFAKDALNSDISIIPAPVSVRVIDEDPFEIVDCMPIHYNRKFEKEACYLEEMLEYPMAYH